MKPGTRVRTVEPLGYKRRFSSGSDVHIAPAGLEGVVLPPDDGDPPNTFHVRIFEPNNWHHLAIIPWVMAVQVEEI